MVPKAAVPIHEVEDPALNQGVILPSGYISKHSFFWGNIVRTDKSKCMEYIEPDFDGIFLANMSPEVRA